MLNLPPNADGNYLHIRANEYDRHVYRIMKWQHFLTLIQKRENVLVKPERWLDPFENFILRSHFVREGRLVEIAHKEYFYGQCWTLQTASDAMWRIYSPDGKGIRVRSTIRKLFGGLKHWRGSCAGQETYVGKVRYLKSADLLAFGRSVLRCERGPLTHKDFAATLLVKRPAFRHEREVRLLFTPHDFHTFAGTVVSYPIEPDEMIDQVMLDPRLDKSEAEDAKAQLIAVGFNGTIKRSLLYAPPPDLLVPLPGHDLPPGTAK